MANNRMWLKNKRTGAQVLLAKYYPATGWYPFHDDIHTKLTTLFEENEPDPSQWGDNDWLVEYDQSTDDSESDEASRAGAISTPQGWAEAITYLQSVRKEMRGLYEDWPSPDGDSHKERIGEIIAQINMLLPEAEARRLAMAEKHPEHREGVNDVGR